MIKELGIASLTLAFALPLAAQTADMDANGDGMVTVAEFMDAMPDAAPGTFGAVDINGDGVLSMDEIADARAAGLLPGG